MCQGSLDPKYALGDLERQFKVARHSANTTVENREPTAGISGWIAALVARFRGKEMTHG